MGSIKMSKLGCKIMSGLTACVIGLSPCIGTQVFAAPVFIRSIKQSKEIEDCTKEELQEVVPDLWQRFCTARGVVFNAAYYAADAADDDGYSDAFNAAGIAAYKGAGAAAYKGAGAAAREAAFNGAGAAASSAAYLAAWGAAFVNTWRPDGVAYKIVKDKDRAYFENLVRVLEEQIDILEDLVNHYMMIYSKTAIYNIL